MEFSHGERIAVSEMSNVLAPPAGLFDLCIVLPGLLGPARRLDLISEVALLQSQVTKAKIEHLRTANRVVQKAKHSDYIGVGLHYRS